MSDINNSISLYQITNGFMELTNLLDRDEITEAEAKEISEGLGLALKEKSVNLIGYALNETSLIDAIDVQIKRLQELKKYKQNNLDRYKAYVKDNMERLGISKIETEIGNISIAKSPLSVEIVNEDLIPKEYKTIVTTEKIDKKKIADSFKSTGEIIPGVNINTNNTNLRIR